MPDIIILSCAAALYLVSTGIWVAQLYTKPRASSARAALVIAWVGWFLHLGVSVAEVLATGQINFSVASMMVSVSAVLVLVFLVSVQFMPIEKLSIALLPLVVSALMFSMSWAGSETTTVEMSGSLGVHMFVAVFAYSVVVLAALQAILFLAQSRGLKQRKKPSLLMALPAMETMELLLFKLLWIGFILLTLTLLSGAYFSYTNSGQAFVFQHHTVLAMLGWLVFGWVLLRRQHFSMSSSTAAIWAVFGFIIIQLGYFGTKIIKEALSIQ